MRFDKSLRERWKPAGDSFVFDMPDGWMQGRSVYGGLTTAAAAALASRSVDDTRTLRAVTVQFLRPVEPGNVSGTSRVLREGKGVSFVETRLQQNREDVLVVHGVFALSRRGSISVAAPSAVPGPDVESIDDLPYLEGLTPECIRHFSLRWARGALPFSGADEAKFGGYCRFRIPSGDAEALLGLLDAWPSPSLSVQRGPAPESSVTWTAHLLHVPESFDGWFWFEYETIVGEGGFHTCAGRLYAPDGRLAAWTEQLVVVFG